MLKGFGHSERMREEILVRNVYQANEDDNREEEGNREGGEMK